MNYHEYIHIIPDYMRPGMIKWIENGVRPGGFLTAVLSNDLFGAFIRADDINMTRIKDYVQFLYCYAPAACFGSLDKVELWEKRGGLNGLNK